MIRASAQAASRAADKLIGDRCSCDESKLLTERLAKLHDLADKLERENAELRAALAAQPASTGGGS